MDDEIGTASTGVVVGRVRGVVVGENVGGSLSADGAMIGSTTRSIFFALNNRARRFKTLLFIVDASGCVFSIIELVDRA
jgi:hypothetical protein